MADRPLTEREKHFFALALENEANSTDQESLKQSIDGLAAIIEARTDSITNGEKFIEHILNLKQDRDQEAAAFRLMAALIRRGRIIICSPVIIPEML